MYFPRVKSCARLRERRRRSYRNAFPDLSNSRGYRIRSVFSRKALGRFDLPIPAVNRHGVHFKITPSHIGKERLVSVLPQRPQDRRASLIRVPVAAAYKNRVRKGVVKARNKTLGRSSGWRDREMLPPHALYQPHDIADLVVQ